MRSFVALVLQLALAAVVGYWAGHAGHDERQAVVPPASPPVAQQPPPLPAAAPAPSGPATATVENLSIGFRSAVEHAAPSVVTVYSARTVPRGILGLGGRALLSQGLGSGVVIDGAGHIVTNNHVVEGANALAVGLPDGTIRDTQLLGVDPDTDLALLKVDPAGLHAITIGDTRNLAVGDVVLAVGNPLGVGQTVTQGIVSALGRKGIGINPIENFIQTDAAINPGNSGGALIDTAGRLVGINSAILSRGGGSEGIGFAIPVDIEQRVVASLLKTGKVARGWLGVATEPAPRGQKGAFIAEVQSRGPADRAGIQAGDVVVRLGDHVIDEPGDLVTATLELEPGTHVPVEVVRNGAQRTLDVELGRRPPLRQRQREGG
jgi:S1-C subfamily serine protease